MMYVSVSGNGKTLINTINNKLFLLSLKQRKTKDKLMIIFLASYSFPHQR